MLISSHIRPSISVCNALNGRPFFMPGRRKPGKRPGVAAGGKECGPPSDGPAFFRQQGRNGSPAPQALPDRAQPGSDV